MTSGLYTDDSGTARCWWCQGHDDYQAYHDSEWGYPVADDHRLFEKICLEGFQSGLSWLTILRKRDNFRKAFHNFNFHRIARFGSVQVKKLLQNDGIVRHRGKIEATVNNAKCALHMEQEFGSLAAFFWQYEPKKRRAVLRNKTDACHRTTCDEAVRLSKDLRKLAWKFVGPTTAYAFMQSMGMVNDHLKGCSSHVGIRDLRVRFKRPTR